MGVKNSMKLKYSTFIKLSVFVESNLLYPNSVILESIHNNPPPLQSDLTPLPETRTRSAIDFCAPGWGPDPLPSCNHFIIGGATVHTRI